MTIICYIGTATMPPHAFSGGCQALSRSTRLDMFGEAGDVARKAIWLSR